MELKINRSLFGTDGVRGKANFGFMRPDMILKLAMGTASLFMRGEHRHVVVIGKDTRLSGYMVESALCAGFVSMGMDVVLVGPLPTPAIGMLTKSLRADLGVMISASHNIYSDNGIKFFGPEGFKLSDREEEKIESIIAQNDYPYAAPQFIGKVRRLEDVNGRYIEYLKARFSSTSKDGNPGLKGYKFVLDCANGAAHRVAPKVLWELGAEIISIGISPDGTNINKECGATYPQTAQDAVLEHQADGAIILDGDADRLIMIDEKGQIIDGDQLMALIATSLHFEGTLKGGGVVATQMSNLGLERYLNSLNLKLIRTAVGDRYVLEAMRQGGYNLGGEQSGHLILSDHSTTGDGLMAALQVLGITVRAKKTLSEVGQVFKAVPQILRNIKGTKSFLEQAEFLMATEKAQKQLGAKGHLLIRPSGTEPLVRIMAQGDDLSLLNTVVNKLAQTIENGYTTN